MTSIPALREVRELRDYRARHGYARTFNRLAAKSLQKLGVMRSSEFIVLWPDRINHAAYDETLAYRRRLLPACEMESLAPQLPSELSPEFLTDAQRRGNYCYVIIDGEALVSFGWYAPASAQLHDRRFEFSRDFVYMYHGYTRPQYRGKRLHALGLAGALHEFHRQGKRALISTVDITNHASLASVRRLGFVNCGYIVQIGRGVLSIRFATRTTRPFAIQFRKGD